jgi:hypothetical protein
LAAGPSAEEAAAVSGTFRGTDALSKLDFQVQVKSLEPSTKTSAALS